MARHFFLFEVNHVGFYAIPDMLHSIAHNFPNTWSLVFESSDYLNRLPERLRHQNLDLSKMTKIKLMVREFACIGTNGFVDEMVACLEHPSIKLDELFPIVDRWVLGDFIKTYESSAAGTRRLSTNMCKSNCDMFPKSATDIFMGLAMFADQNNGKELARVATKFVDNPLHSFYSNLVMDGNVFDCLAFQQLAKLSIVCRLDFSTSILPRSLTSLNLLIPTMAELGVYTVTLLEAPQHLVSLKVQGNCILEMCEVLPPKLQVLKTTTIVDPSYKLSATTLPKSLKKASFIHVLLDISSVEEDNHFAKHLFRHVSDDEWVSSWPDALEFDMETLIWDNASLNILCNHLKRVSARSTSCDYTWRRMSLYYEYYCDLSKEYYISSIPTKPNEVLAFISSINLLETINMKSFVLDTIHSILLSIDHLPLYQNFDAHITDINLKSDPSQNVLYAKSYYVLANIHKICVSLSSLNLRLDTVDGSTNMCSLPIPFWVKSLTLDKVPGGPLHYARAENVESLQMPAPKKLQQTRNPVSWESNISTDIPPILLCLPPNLTSLDLTSFGNSIDDPDYFNSDIAAFFVLLPKTLLYLYLRQRAWGKSIIAIPSLKNIAILLPPNLRLFDCTTFQIQKHVHVVEFAHQVATIPSLRHLVIVYYLKRFTDIKSDRCFELANQPIIDEEEYDHQKALLELTRVLMERPKSPPAVALPATSRFASITDLLLALIAVVIAYQMYA